MTASEDSVQSSSEVESSGSIVQTVYTQRHFKLRTAVDRLDDNPIGDQWEYLASINGGKVPEEMDLNVGDVITIDLQFTEQDEYPDVGTASGQYTVKAEDLVNGFELSLDLTVPENAGKGKGLCAYFKVTFTFEP